MIHHEKASSVERQIPRRSVLVAPGADERKVRKALQSTADEVVIDLEDAVTVANKDRARALVVRVLEECVPISAAVSVRINSLSTQWAEDDLSACADVPALTSVVVPKVDTVQDMTYVDRVLGGTDLRVQALIETPLGVREVDNIACSIDRLDALIIGYADLGAALGRSPAAPAELWFSVQDRVVIAARAASIAVIDGPSLSTHDDTLFMQACVQARDIGFDGKWVIHPGQIDTVTTVFTPSSDEVEEARRVLTVLDDAEARGQGAAQLDGRMLDEAVAVAARRVLARIEG